MHVGHGSNATCIFRKQPLTAKLGIVARFVVQYFLYLINIQPIDEIEESHPAYLSLV
jgi:hypothetical protein